MTLPKPRPAPRPCARCGKLFQPIRGDRRKTCSDACAKARQRMLNVCKEIGDFYDKLARSEEALKG
jgi:hypothetical protein